MKGHVEHLALPGSVMDVLMACCVDSGLEVMCLEASAICEFAWIYADLIAEAQ